MTNGNESVYPHNIFVDQYGNVHSSDDYGNSNPLTKREIFASTAPEPPSWFVHEFRKKPHRRQYLDYVFGKISCHPLKDFFVKYYDDENDTWDKEAEIPEEFKQEVSAHVEGIVKDNEEIARWEAEDKIERFFHWRIFYADKLIEQLNK